MLAGLLPACIGLWMLYLVKRRKFQRCNQYGVEVFRSYGHLLFTRSLDRVQQLAAWILVIGGGAYCVLALLNT